jgi:fatty-acid peroxygenase
MTDLALRIVRSGYAAVELDRADRNAGDDYETRLLGARTVVLRSRDGARLFYDESVVRRRGAVPAPLRLLLFGRGAVHGLDGQAHRDRKLLLVDVLSADRLGSIVDAVEERLRRRVPAWSGQDVNIFDELATAYGGAVLSWAGVPASGGEADLSRRLARIVDGFGMGDPVSYARAWRARVAADRWARSLVEAVRRGELPAAGGSALDRICGSQLDSRTGAVELLNVLRPTVAVAWLGAFATVRLAEQPDLRARLAAESGARERLAFAQEVRRTTPFVPVLAGRVKRRVDALGLTLEPRDRVLLDVVGINGDPERWPDPGRFDAERFLHVAPGAFDLVQQGGGHPSGHRCPGESLALRLLDVTTKVLADVDYRVVGSAAVDTRRIPTLPGEGPVVRVGGDLTQPRPARGISAGRGGSVAGAARPASE